ncbi:hypothetical protein BSKO_09982 [Bryopsis sp. KO-2023]|nr:hypothetical protein BSKO_09982 [Bryopsis sp. KO-2023]
MTRSLCLLGLIFLGVVAVSGSSSRSLKQFVPFVALTCDFQGPFPYMVSLKTQAGEHLCGGVLISKTSVLTAAHCVDQRSSPRSNPYPQLSIGGFDLDNPIEKRWTVGVTMHPGWTGLRQFGNDLAILKMNAPTCVKTIPAIGTHQLFSMPSIFLGFGRTSTNGPFPNKLLAGKFTAFGEQTCRDNQAYPISGNAGETYCAKGPSGTGGVCEGDEGGPSILRPSVTEFSDMISGIASYTSGTGQCSDKNTYAVFTDVTYYKTWIENNM